MKSMIFVFIMVMSTSVFSQGFQPVAKSICASPSDFTLNSHDQFEIDLAKAEIDYYSEGREAEEEFLSLDRIQKRFIPGVYTLWFGAHLSYEELRSNIEWLMENSKDKICLYNVEGMRGYQLYFEGVK